MTISAKVVAASKSREGIELVTFELRYPKFIHAELMTHRVFSRNASSSRAIPVSRLIADIKRDPAIPVHWGRNEKGMQAREELKGWRLWAAQAVWNSARRAAIRRARLMDMLGGHKQLVNRIIETHGHINVVLSTTKLDNFFGLRCHADADPTMKELADRMFDAYHTGGFDLLKPGEWHLPYVSRYEIDRNSSGRRSMDLVKVSVARCARVSYKTHDGRDPSYTEDLKLYDRLVGSKPLHASPTEHQATPDAIMAHPELWGNFHGWIQYRKTLPGESGEVELESPEAPVQEHRLANR